MRQLFVSGVLVLILAATPVGVMAQATSLTPEMRAQVVEAAQEVGRRVVPGLAGPSPIGQIFEDPSPQPLPEEPEPEPEDGPFVLPELNLTDLVEYRSSEGVTIQAPADWLVEADAGGDVLFYIEVPGTDMVVTLGVDTDLDFPSPLAVTLFRSQADLLLREFGEEAQLHESTTIFTAQGLPLAKLSFSGELGTAPVAGAFYVMAPNENLYLLLAEGTQEDLDYAAAGMDLIGESLTFDEDLVGLVAAGDEPMIHVDRDETVEVEVPAGWFALDTGDPQFPVILSEPDALYVATIGTEAAFGENFDPEFLEIADMDLDPDEYEELIGAIIDTLGSTGSPIQIEEEQSEVIPREGALMVRLVGAADLEEGLSMPVLFYADLRSGDAGVVAIFGDIDSALALEDEIMTLVQSVTGVE